MHKADVWICYKVSCICGKDLTNDYEVEHAQKSWKSFLFADHNACFLLLLRLLVLPPVPTSWGSACPSSSSWGTASSTPWLGTRWRRSACRGSSRSTARSALISPTLLDSWVSFRDFSTAQIWRVQNVPTSLNYEKWAPSSIISFFLWISLSVCVWEREKPEKNIIVVAVLMHRLLNIKWQPNIRLQKLN